MEEQKDVQSKGWRPTQAEVVEFLNTQPLGVLATLNETGAPSAALVGFSQNADLELIIGTSDTSRKAKNMVCDGRVAFTASDTDKKYTVQFEGVATKLAMDDFDQRAEAHFAKLPYSAPFRHIPGQCYFLLTPTWARFTDCSSYPWAVTEFTF